MTTFRLVLSISPNDLSSLQAAGFQIFLTRPVNNQANVVWQAIRPTTSIMVEFDDTYGIYATSSPLVTGGIIRMMSIVGPPVQEQALYTLEPTGMFSPPGQPMGGPGSFAAQAAPGGAPNLGLGLAQRASVNGTIEPNLVIFVQPVVPNMPLIMTPSDIVEIAVANRPDQAGTFTQGPMGPTSRAQFSAAQPTVEMAYNPNTGTFV